MLFPCFGVSEVGAHPKVEVLLRSQGRDTKFGSVVSN